VLRNHPLAVDAFVATIRRQLPGAANFLAERLDLIGPECSPRLRQAIHNGDAGDDPGPIARRRATLRALFRVSETGGMGATLSETRGFQDPFPDSPRTT
jgi:hypothetical protein